MNSDDTKLPAPIDPAATSTSTGQIVASFLEMARDPSVDAAKMKMLVDVQAGMIDRIRAEEFSRDFNAACREMPIIEKDGKITDRNGNLRSRYSHFENLMLNCQPILQAHRITATFDTTGEGADVQFVVMILMHDNGHVERRGPMPVPVTSPNQTVSKTQAASMALTTGKRQLLKAVLGLVERGDDGVEHLFAQKDQGADDPKMMPVIYAAEQAAAAGVYAVFFDKLSATERAYLIYRGYHKSGQGWIGRPEIAE